MLSPLQLLYHLPCWHLCCQCQLLVETLAYHGGVKVIFLGKLIQPIQSFWYCCQSLLLFSPSEWGIVVDANGKRPPLVRLPLILWVAAAFPFPFGSMTLQWGVLGWGCGAIGRGGWTGVVEGAEGGWGGWTGQELCVGWGGWQHGGLTGLREWQYGRLAELRGQGGGLCWWSRWGACWGWRTTGGRGEREDCCDCWGPWARDQLGPQFHPVMVFKAAYGGALSQGGLAL